MTQDRDLESKIIYPWDAYIAPTERISIEVADGRKAASTIRQYPPGIPEIIPGMTYSKLVVDTLKTAYAAGGDIIGIDMESDPYINVLLEKPNENAGLNIQTFNSSEISKELSDEIADFFRIGFSMAPYFHYAFHESDPLQSLPHTLDFEAYAVSCALPDTKQRSACQDALREVAIDKAIKHPETQDINALILPNGFHLWTDKIICREQITERLSDPGYVALVKDPQTGQLEGLLHSRVATVERLFQSEEWFDPLIFSSYKNPNLQDKPERFYEKIKYHFDLLPTDQVLTISAQILSPKAQGGEVFYEMMRSISQCVSPEHTKLPMLCEIPPFGTAHTLNTAFANRIVFGVLKNTHPIIFSAQTAQAIYPFISQKTHWHSALRKAIQDKRHYRTKYFCPQPTDNPNVSVKPNGKLGLAVFATANIPNGSCIAVFTGETYFSDTALGLPSIMRDHAIQVGADEFVFGYKGLAHCVCHSCEPNCGIRNRTEIFATKDITAGEQITWDYRCSENSNWVLENCLCGSKRCTSRVGNYNSLPQSLKEEYLSKGMVSEWLSKQ